MHGSAWYKRCCRRVCLLSTEIDSRTILDTGRREGRAGGGGRGEGKGERRGAGGADEAAEWERAAEEGGCEDGSATSYGRH